MADISFARKYRPRTLDEYMGDKIKKIVLSRFSDEKNYPQTILLYGTRGCGKTSLCRLLSREYLCMSKIDGRPCGKCDICLELEETLFNGTEGLGSTIVREVDVGEDRKMTDIEPILDEFAEEPMPGFKYKILILDECHMLPKGAQNRLLKVLEEPKPHMIFMLCSTNPEALLPTVLSRIQFKLEVKKHSVEDLANRLLHVCQQEKIQVQMEALRVIAKISDRIPREALNLLEEVAKNYGNVVTVENVREYKGQIASDIYMDYYKAANTSLERVMEFTKKLKELDISHQKFIRGLTQFTLDCIYIRYGINLDDYPADYVKQVKEFFSIYNSEEMDTILQIIEYANKMIDGDEIKAELILITTAMRIGKTKLLAIGLTNEKEQAEKENKASFNNYKQLIKQDIEATKTVQKANLGGSLLLSVFGQNVTEVQGGANIFVKDKEEKEEEGTSKSASTYSDEELLDLFEKFK